MKRKKGFTLIELLAVIVILAIIAVIATPIIVGIIEDSRKAAFERSVEGIIHATDLDYSTQEILSNDTYTITNGQLDKTLKTPIKNIEGFSGTIKYNEKGNSTYAIHNGKWCMMKDDSGNITTAEYDASTCKLAGPLSDDCFVTEDLENGGVAIVDYLCTETDVIIPDTVNGKIVKEITGREVYVDDGDYYEYNGAFEADCYYDEDWNYVCYNQITSIKLPDSVISIGKRAFVGNSIIGELDLSNTSLISIGNEAFYGGYDRSQNQITSIKLPNSITNIGDYAFENNALSGELDLSHLTNLIKIDSFGSNNISSIKLPISITTISGNAFVNNALSGELDLSYLTNLTNISGFNGNEINKIKLPDSVISIGESAFQSNKISGELDLSNLTNLTSIGNYAFYNNVISSELNLSNTSLISIGNSAFAGASDGSKNQITSIKLPDSVASIGKDAFLNNALSGELDLSHLTNLIKIDSFGSNNISSIKLPISITTISGNAFGNNALSGELDLSYLTNLTTIETALFTQGAFSGNSLTDLKLPKNLINIGKDAFAFNALTSVTFVGRSNLDGVTLGDYVWGWALNHNESNSIFFE